MSATAQEDYIMKYDKAMELVAALRSGKYKQTNGYLHDNKGFCCLGVACDLAGAKWHEAETDDYFELKYKQNGRQYDQEAVLTPYYKKLYGFRDIDGEFAEGFSVTYKDKQYRTLAELNDAGASFKRIASLIEKHWEKM
jgi:hypothetical protein